MNLAEVIHQRWAAAAALENLLPASRVYTGMSVDPATPYAVIAKLSDRPAGYHNDGSALSTVPTTGRVDLAYRFGEDVTGERWVLSLGSGFIFPRRSAPVISYQARPPP